MGTFLVPFGSDAERTTVPAAYCVVFAIYPLLPGRASVAGVCDPGSEKTGLTEAGYRKDAGGGSESPAELAASGFFAGLTAVPGDLPAAALTAALLVPLLYTRPLRTLICVRAGTLLVPVVALLRVQLRRHSAN